MIGFDPDKSFVWSIRDKVHAPAIEAAVFDADLAFARSQSNPLALFADERGRIERDLSSAITASN